MYNYYGSDYNLILSTPTGAIKYASVSFGIDDMFSDNFKIQATFFNDNNIFIDLSADTYEEVIESINSVVFSSTLVLMCKTMMVYSKIDDVDFSKYDEMLLKQVKGIDVQETSFKDHLIKTLEDTLTKLNCN